MAESSYDYLILGGGLSGCVVASRLKQALPHSSIALVENGSDSRNDESVLSPAQAWLLDPAKYHYVDQTVPQKSLNGRSLELKTGRALGGGSATNYGGWTRGDRQGYDEWARVVGDDRWSYEGLLPFFKKSESFPVPGMSEHGYEGPIRPSLVDRQYPLKQPILDAITGAGVKQREDITDGDVLGVGPLMESWRNNQRVHAANSYDLTGVEILTNTKVAKVLLDGKKAIGAVLRSGERLLASKEVILACGALRTPQVLMLSGIGPKAELEQLGIPPIAESPNVGKNLHDHPMFTLWYTLRNPDDGLAVGHPKFMANPGFLEGNPMDWLVNGNAAASDKEKAAKIDGVAGERTDDFELTPFYLGAPTSPHAPPPMDGETITCAAVVMSATSRGEVTLQSNDLDDAPLVDPNYLSTAHDLAVMRAGVRLAMKIMETTDAGQMISVGQRPSQRMKPIPLGASDEEIDERAKAGIVTCFHYAGTASMGKVVDAECRVKGIEGLRVIDASIMPGALCAHLQAPMYGVAERAAEMIVEKAKEDQSSALAG